MNIAEVMDLDAGADLEAVVRELREMNERLAGMERAMHEVERRFVSLEELREDLWPLAQGVSTGMARKLHELERAGAVGFARESLRVGERIATSFTEDDVRLLGEHVVGILQTVKNLTQPEVLEVADRAASALRAAEENDGPRPGLLRGLRDPRVRRGMALLMVVLRELGQERPVEPVPAAAGDGTGEQAVIRDDDPPGRIEEACK